MARSAAPAPTPQAAAPSSPSDACAGRNFIARTLCITEQCLHSRFTSHPQCVKLREDQRRREIESITGAGG